MSNYLQRFGDGYSFRRRVPAALQGRLGIREIYRSVATSSRRMAQERAAQLFLATQEIFRMARELTHTDDEIRAAAKLWLDTLGRNFRNAIGEMSPAELSACRGSLAEDYLRSEVERSGNDGVSPEVRRRFLAEDGLEAAGFAPTIEVSRPVKTETVRRHPLSPRRPLWPPGATEATSMRWHPMDIERMESAMREALDHVIRQRWAEMTGLADARPSAPSDGSAKKASPLFSEWIKKFMDEKGRHSTGHRPYTAQTLKQTEATFRIFVNIIGERAVCEYSREDAGRFRETLLKLPASFGKGNERDAQRAIKLANLRDAENLISRGSDRKSLTQRMPLVPRMTMKTTKRHFSTMTQYWKYLATYGHVDDGKNIFTGWTFQGTKSNKLSRDSWSPQDLRLLFGSSDWRERGPTTAEHWLPLIALHSGMRLDEIGSLRLPQDIGEEDGVLHFNVREHFDQRGDEADPVTGKFEPKSPAGVRRVPVHSWLLGHGLMDLVDRRRREGARLLFPDLRPSGVDRKLSAKFSREFSRLKKRLGVSKKTVFHSFRITFRTAVAQSNLPDSMLDAVTGHEAAVPGRLVDAATGRSAQNRGVGADYERPGQYEIRILQKVVETFVPPIDFQFIKPVGDLIKGKGL